jgi:hypothetical protein
MRATCCATSSIFLLLHPNILLRALFSNTLSLFFSLNPLKMKLIYILFKNSVCTSKRTPTFTITKINWLMPFKEIIAVYSENHAKPINTKCSIAYRQSRWFI